MELGTLKGRVKALYGNRATLRTFEGEGGEYSAYVIFGADGALMLNLGEGNRAVAMHPVRGTSLDDLEAFVGGC